MMNLVYKNEKPLFIITLVLAIIFWAAVMYFTHLGALIFLVLFYVIYLFGQGGFIAYLRGTGVKITEEQFPDLHQRLLAACAKLGMTKIPDAYVLRTDFFNAFATRFLGRDYVVLFSDVLDAFETEPDAVDFYFGHELGHIHRRHLLWAPVIAPISFLPLLGASLRRAEEYTCDNYGVACCKSEAAVQAAIAALSAGNSHWSKINLEAYRKQVADTSGFWMSFNELIGDYPWLTKRMVSAIAKFRAEEITHPSRNGFAYVFAFFTPRIGFAGGAAGLIPIVAIIGILAAIALPAYQEYVVKSKLTMALMTEREVAAKVDAYYQTHQELPANLIALGYSEEVLNNEKQGIEISFEADSGTIKATVAGTGFGTLNLEPATAVNGLTWTCTAYGFKARQVPRTCVATE